MAGSRGYFVLESYNNIYGVRKLKGYLAELKYYLWCEINAGKIFVCSYKKPLSK